MSSNIHDLWPESFTPARTITPLSILREQAELLGKKTRNIVEAYVESRSVNGGLTHVLVLSPSILDGVRVELIQLNHSLINLYPVTVELLRIEYPEYEKGMNNQVLHLIGKPGVDYIPDPRNSTISYHYPLKIAEVSNQDGLVAVLREILSATPVRQLIESLMAQSLDPAA